jgi:hypothetical protein
MRSGAHAVPSQDADTGAGVSRSYDPCLLPEAWSSDVDACGSRFEGTQQLVRPQGRREPYPQYKDVQSGFEVSLLVSKRQVQNGP